VLWRRQRLADRVGLDHRADLFEGADPGRERVPIAIDDAVELAQQGGGLFVGQVKVHDPHMGSLTFPAESAPARHEFANAPVLLDIGPFADQIEMVGSVASRHSTPSFPRDKASRGPAREEEAMLRERFEDTARTRVPLYDASQSGGAVC
jgi:hypothetical protein